ncbi:MAG: hypothetical protein EAZ27_12625 [Cytophagales bacterium]|nr:MAG: hypothetical protein EAZ27_12625 [Cytophagales bacterium]
MQYDIIKILNANQKLQKSLAIPNLEFGIIANPQNTQPYFGWYFQMPIPIFDRNKANIGKAKSQILQSELKKNALDQDITTQINFTYQEYIINKSNFERYNDIRKNSYAILKEIKLEYLKGKTTLVDYLQAKQTWNETEHEYDISNYKFRKSYLDLLLVSGILSQ